LESAIGDFFEGSSGSLTLRRRSFTAQWATTWTPVCICNLYRAWWEPKLEIITSSMYADFNTV
jgi:hypothetical protein